MKETVAQVLASRKEDVQAKKYVVYGELLGVLTKDKLKWADPKEVKAVFDAAFEAQVGPREVQPAAKEVGFKMHN